MPPFLPRKRLASTPLLAALPNQSHPGKRTKLTDVLDKESASVSGLQTAQNFTLGDDDSVSSLSDINSDGFEDVLEDREESHDEGVDWEDAMAGSAQIRGKRELMAGGNLELNLSKNLDELEDHTTLAAKSSKKGPTKIEREIRVQTHCMHVQFLLYHNAIRNSWACDSQVQAILVKQLPQGIDKEIQKWRAATGLSSKQEGSSKDIMPKTKSKMKTKKIAVDEERNQRAWGRSSSRLENGTPDLSRGDPIIPLLKVLSAYWKKRFTITAPGLRKSGYASAAVRQRQIRSFQNDKHDPEKHGEKIANLSEFRNLARRCEGSRDVGAQLFTALLRGLGIESRLVANLQCSGFGWTKNEQAEPKKSGQPKGEAELSSNDVSDEAHDPAFRKARKTTQPKPNASHGRKGRAGDVKGKGLSNDPVDLDPDPLSEDDFAFSDRDDASVVDLTATKSARKPSRYDRDLPFPNYWTEVVSPINSLVIPVSPLVLPNPVASTPEILSTFEPRGAKAEKAKQVIAYVVAHMSDGSAKDVTTRYLKKRIWPGKTKGFRMPVEKVPVYNKRGKVLRYEEYDWFKSVMSGYVRTDKMRTVADDVEESTDLVPQQPERKENKQESDTLQSLKSSAEFVLERFLRREEALKPDAEPVRTFATGKGDNLKEENIYRRADVERCLSAESWHKEGRQIKQGEAPLKLVPIRAVTLTRKREVEEMQRQTGEKPTQGLYCRAQTEYIIPPPIKDGVIPKNSYGNIDCFVPSMVPRGAVHIPLRGTVRICKKLQIDYAEAVTGFEFGHKLAVPVVEGVVVAEEHEIAVREAWEEYAEKQRAKEEDKLEKAVLNLWKRMLMGLRIRERVSDTYGEDAEPDAGVIDLEEGPGRFNDALPPPHDTDRNDASRVAIEDGGGFLLPYEDNEDQAAASTELLIDHHDTVTERKRKEVAQYPTPVSMTSASVKKDDLADESVTEAIDSVELSEVDSVNNDHGTESRRRDLDLCNEAQSPSPIVHQHGGNNAEAPKKRRRIATEQPRGIHAKDVRQPGVSPSREEPTQSKGSRQSHGGVIKRTPGKPGEASPRIASTVKRKQQPRRASQKTALTSPYFESQSDAD